jgi:hypothetical protein
MSSTRLTFPFPRWHRTLLKAAGLYNLVWGGFAILFPMTLFRLVGMDPLPNYPELWQCIGMIVGVYGIGYWIAAADPVRHWPVVLVGLLGKILGPIGFLQATLNERFPAAMGLTILTNDLIWWVPFSLILWNAKIQTAKMSSAIEEPMEFYSVASTSRRRSPEARSKIVWSSVQGAMQDK